MKTRGVLAAANLAVMVFFLLSWTPHGPRFLSYRVDLDVYRIGGRVWLNGGHLYDALPATALGIRLPFTYPPFAAIVFSPLSLIPIGVAGLLVTFCTMTLLVIPLRTYLRRLAWPLGWVLPVALFLEPVRSTIQFGQVNVVLMTLVIADCLSQAPRWPRGSLTGLAAAVKLTPLPFVLFFVLRRDYRAAGVMSLSFAACTGLGLVLAPGDSIRYWTSVVFDTASRIGNPAYAPNQSILGVLARAGLHPGTPAATSLWLALSAAVGTVTCLGMRRAIAAADNHLALVLNAFAALLVSPISWSHHWVWAGPAVLALAAAGRDGRLRTGWLAAVAGLVTFLAAPQWWFDREPHWALWQQAVGDSYVLFAASVLIMSTRVRSSFRYIDQWRSPVSSPAWSSAAASRCVPARPPADGGRGRRPYREERAGASGRSSGGGGTIGDVLAEWFADDE